MGRASDALKQVLDTYSISQNKLAVTMGISRANVGRWYHGLDPSAENIAQITQSLKTLNPLAAKDFVRLYLGTIIED
ncbi:helix-turn-helix domain-containing protein [Nodosilinea nodulosa]|uniref:helix-turn-helix domain-containing protein n=1 Tax=Nodosilinea TaxID=1120752 RepID=UPI0002D98102|nr:helix-turn-helix transcriptional regulator [Nodosilinea nodulosa]